MTKKRARERNVRWRTMGDTLARNRVARWMIRHAEIRRERGRPLPRPGKTLLVRSLAWAVHFYTALGLVCAAGIVALLIRGDAAAFRGSFLLMILATFIDSTDGTLARRVRVKEVLPGFDGRRLDDLVDWLTYTCLPLMLLWRAEVLPAGMEAWLVVPLLASAYGFCQTAIKTDDGYFLGFPSLWNFVAFYLYVLDLPRPIALGVVLVLSALTFVPSRYLYPSSRPGLLNTITNLGGAAWVLVMLAILCLLPSASTPGHRVVGTLARGLVWASLAYPIWASPGSGRITGSRRPRPASPGMPRKSRPRR